MKRFFGILCGLFVLLVVLYAQEAFKIIQNGNVGIGVDNPSAKLEVDGNIKANGRVMDKTGFVMPVGTVLPFAGDTAPQGWLLCDGTSYDGSDGSQYRELYLVIRTNFGGSGETFNVPDLRGKFLRGVDNGAGIDPDSSTRTALMAGGNSGDTVGSYEEDAFQGHYHQFFGRTAPETYGSGSNHCEDEAITSVDNHLQFIGNPKSDGVNGTPRVSSETRPLNVAVNYIIKY